MGRVSPRETQSKLGLCGAYVGASLGLLGPSVLGEGAMAKSLRTCGHAGSGSCCVLWLRAGDGPSGTKMLPKSERMGRTLPREETAQTEAQTQEQGRAQ